MEDLYPPGLEALARRAVARIRRRMRDGAPGLATPVGAWMRSLAGGSPPERYFTHPGSFPMLLLPWWLEESIRGEPDEVFQRDLVYSTLTGYYFVRMIDDLMDRAAPPDPRLLPALIFFHTEFQRTHQRHFPYQHRFWTDFLAASYAAADTASRDAALADVSREDFLAISSRKVAGARVPIAAVCHRYGRAQLVAPWAALVDLLGRWHQMLNDIRGWSGDLERGTRTYFLSEAERRIGASASIGHWVVMEGLEWGMRELERWMDELLGAARRLESPPLVTYLEQRQRLLAAEWEALAGSLAPLRRLESALRATPARPPN